MSLGWTSFPRSIMARSPTLRGLLHLPQQAPSTVTLVILLPLGMTLVTSTGCCFINQSP